MKIFLFLAALLLSSCASILNSPTQEIIFEYDRDIKRIFLSDSVQHIRSGNDTFHVLRSSIPLKFTVQGDSAIEEIFLEPRSSFAYWLNIPFTYGIGMLWDRNSPKRYLYQSQIFLRREDSVIALYRMRPTDPGSINWIITAPHINFFLLETTDGRKKASGFWGIETGAEYFLSFLIVVATEV